MLLIKLKGINGQLNVYDNKIEITRKGFLGFVSNGLSCTKTIPTKNITSVQLKPGTFFTNGYIQFNTAGKIESTGGLLKSTLDENTVMFRRKDNHTAERIKSLIETVIL